MFYYNLREPGLEISASTKDDKDGFVGKLSIELATGLHETKNAEYYSYSVQAKILVKKGKGRTVSLKRISLVLCLPTWT